MPKISVIVPVYNVENYLCECLDSILKQTLNDLEIICVNDGSTDGSLSILENYAQKDIRIKIVNQQNQGVSCSRNNGLDIANGEYVAFIDSDDYLNSEEYFAKLYDACERSNADIAVAGIIRGNEKSKKDLIKYDEEQFADDYVAKLKLCDVPDSNYTCNKIYKRESLLKSGIKFLPNVMYEDIYYTYKVLYYIGRVVSVPNVTYFYRKRPGSIIKKNNKKAVNDRDNGRIEMEQFFKEHNIDVSDFQTVEKKFKMFGLTVFKTLRKGKDIESVLFNFIRRRYSLK